MTTPLDMDYPVSCFSGATRMQSQLGSAFDLVAPKPNWKMSIDTEVNGILDPVLISDAVVHFTGSVPEMRPMGKMLSVKAAGYYLTVGA